MGNATQFTEDLKRQQLSAAEQQERQASARVREDLTTTPAGEIAPLTKPKVAPVPVYSPQPATWD